MPTRPSVGVSINLISSSLRSKASASSSASLAVFFSMGSRRQGCSACRSRSCRPFAISLARTVGQERCTFFWTRRSRYQRHKLAKRIKELQPEASNRSVAKVLGVDEITVRRDTAANAAPEQEKPSKTNAAESTSAANAAPTILSGAAAAQAVQSKETKEERKQAKVEAAVQWEQTGVCW